MGGSGFLRSIASHELEFRDAAGGRLAFSISEILNIVLSRNALIFFALSMLAFFAADPPRLRDHLPVPVAAMMWPIALAQYVIWYFLLFVATAFVQRTIWDRAVFLPILGLIAMIPAIGVSELIASKLSGGSYAPSLVPKLGYYFITVQVFEFAFVRLLIPQLREAEEVPVRTLRFGDRQIPIKLIRMMNAQEHYVRLVTAETAMRERVRFGDLMTDLEPCDGIRPHRSWWVGRAAAPRLAGSSDRPVLRLDDGAEVPVARSRLREVQKWLEDHGLTTEHSEVAVDNRDPVHTE